MMFSLHNKVVKFLSLTLVAALILSSAATADAAQKKDTLAAYKNIPNSVLAAAASLSGGSNSFLGGLYNITIDRTANIFVPLFYSPSDIVVKKAATTTKQNPNVQKKNIVTSENKKIATTTVTSNVIETNQVKSVVPANTQDNTSSFLGLFRSLVARVAALENRKSSTLVQNVYNTYTTQNVSGGSSSGGVSASTISSLGDSISRSVKDVQDQINALTGRVNQLASATTSATTTGTNVVAGFGLYFNGDVLNVSTSSLATSSSVFGLNGSNAFYTAGNVGVGTSSPDANFTVYGNGGSGSYNNYPTVFALNTQSSDPWAFSIRRDDFGPNSDISLFNDAGNTGGSWKFAVGDGAGDYEYPFDIDKYGAIARKTTGNQNLISLGGTGSDWGLISTPGANKWSLGSGFNRHANPSVTALTWDTSGNVGIGTTTPSYKLDVAGDINFTGTLYQNGVAFSAGGSSVLSINSNNSLWTSNTTEPTNSDAIYLGTNAGAGITGNGAQKSNFIGYYAGNGATNAYNANFIGVNAGEGATHADKSNFIGHRAGYNATNASYANFIGRYTGYNATNAYDSNFLGQQAGYGATDARYANFMGSQAGSGATGANDSNFFGSGAGYAAYAAANSVFIGTNAGYGSSNAAHSLFLGENAGTNDSVDNVSTPGWSVLVGRDISTGGFSNSILLGGSNSGTIANTAANQFMVAPSVTDFNLVGVNYKFPTSQGGANQVLTNDGSGNLSWSSASSGSGVFTMSANHSVYSSDTVAPVSGSYNFFSGFNAGGGAQTTGDNNIAIGPDAFYNNTSGYNNVALGSYALVNNDTGANNTAIGYFAGQHNTSGYNNVFTGNQSGNQNTTGNDNVFSGASSGYSNTSGAYNVFLGYGAGDTNTDGSENIVIGKNADVGSPSLTNAIAIGSGAVVNNSNTLVLGASGTAVSFGNAYTFPTSDGTAGYVLSTDGSGHVSWQAAGSGGSAAINWRGAWDNSNSYSVGDAVSYNGSSYYAIQAVSANGSYYPDAYPGQWGLLASVGSQGPAGADGANGSNAVINWRGSWDYGATYNTGDAVSYNGSSYYAIQYSPGSSGYYPDSYTSYWGLLASVGSQGATGDCNGCNYYQTIYKDGSSHGNSNGINFTGAGVTVADDSTYGVNVDIAGSQWTSTGSDIYFNTGKVAIGGSSPSARLHISGGDGSGSSASLKIDSGTLLSSPESGAIESDGTHLYYTDSGNTRHQLDQQGGGSSQWSDINSSTIAYNPNAGASLIGIGTSNPLSALHVAKDDNSSNLLGQIVVTGGTDVNKVLSMGYNTSSDYGFLQAYTNGGSSNGLALNPNGGNVGVSMVNPAYTFDVNGDINFTGTLYHNGTAFSGGSAAINWRGAWDNSNSYSVGDAVSYNGSSYYAIQAVSANGSYYPDAYPGQWGLLASVGSQGPAGADGANGSDGAQGPQGEIGSCNNCTYNSTNDTYNTYNAANVYKDGSSYGTPSGINFTGSGVTVAYGTYGVDVNIDAGGGAYVYNSSYQNIYSANSSFTPTYGSYNYINGFDAGRSASGIGSYNNIEGYTAGYSMFGSASYNNVFGNAAGYLMSGSYNNAIGYGAGNSISGNSNSVMGYNAGYAISGTSNVAIGDYAAYSTTGSYNTNVGMYSGYSITSGNNNTFLGYNAGNTDGSVSTTGGIINSTAIGYNAQVYDSNQLILGGQNAYSVKVGIGTYNPTHSLEIRAGSNSDGNIYAEGDICTGSYCLNSFSDQRLKKDISSLATSTLEKILALNPVTYKWNDIYLADHKEMTDATSTKIGFIAQEMDMVFPEVVTHSSNGYLGVDYSKLTAVLAQGIKELNSKFEGAIEKVQDGITYIKSLTVGTLQINDKVCVDDVCVTKEEFKQILLNKGNSNNTVVNSPAPAPVVPVINNIEPGAPVSNPADNSTSGTSANNTASDTSSDVTPVNTDPVSVPDTSSSVAPAPVPVPAVDTPVTQPAAPAPAI